MRSLSSLAKNLQARRIPSFGRRSRNPAPCATTTTTTTFELRSNFDRTLIVETTIRRSSSSNTDTTHNNDNNMNDMESRRLRLLDETLDGNHVLEYGWTKDAISSATSAMNWPPASVGLIDDPSKDLVNRFMERCQEQWEQTLQSFPNKNSDNSDDSNSSNNTQEQKQQEDEEEEEESVQNRIQWALRQRLELIAPYIPNGRWAEAMAIGAHPSHVFDTTCHLDRFIQATAQFATQGLTSTSPLGRSEQLAIGAVYIACELHALADPSWPQLTNTWAFLDDRCNDLNTLATMNITNTINSSSSSSSLDQILSQWTMILSSILGTPTNNTTSNNTSTRTSTNETTTTTTASTLLTASAAVVSSLGGAIISLGMPVARTAISAAAATLVPQIMAILDNNRNMIENHNFEYQQYHSKMDSTVSTSPTTPLPNEPNRTVA